MTFLSYLSFCVPLFSQLNEEDLLVFVMVRSRTDPEIPGISDGAEEGRGSPGSS